MTRVVHPSTQDVGKDLNVAMSDEKVTGKKATLKMAGMEREHNVLHRCHVPRVYLFFHYHSICTYIFCKIFCLI